jgi:hypothetical protein
VSKRKAKKEEKVMMKNNVVKKRAKYATNPQSTNAMP